MLKYGHSKLHNASSALFLIYFAKEKKRMIAEVLGLCLKRTLILLCMIRHQFCKVFKQQNITKFQGWNFTEFLRPTFAVVTTLIIEVISVYSTMNDLVMTWPTSKLNHLKHSLRSSYFDVISVTKPTRMKMIICVSLVYMRERWDVFWWIFESIPHQNSAYTSVSYLIYLCYIFNKS